MFRDLAIVIPYYKKSFFKKCLSSLVVQTNKNFNVYIGDDASPESPQEIIDSFREFLPLNYKRFDCNLGEKSLTSQWDRCMSLIKNEKWVLILGDDDLLGENCVEEFYNHLEEIKKLNIQVVRFSTQEIDDKNKVISPPYFHPRIERYNDLFNKRFFEGSRSSLSEYVFSVDQYRKYGFRKFSLGWHADDMAWLDFSEFGCIFSINEARVSFRLSDQNISRSNYLIEQKKEISYHFFQIISQEHLDKFDRETSQKVLRKVEQLTYDLNKVSFIFWLKYFPLFLKKFDFLETLKFSRRILINHSKSGR